MRAIANLRAEAIVEAFARVPREDFLGPALVTDGATLFRTQACHVLQPDIDHCGALLEARKIAVLGEKYPLGVAPHNPNGPSPTQ